MSLEHYLFGPLDKSYCMLFYYFSVVYFFGFLIVAFGTVASMVKYQSKMNMFALLGAAYTVFVSFLMYIITRLLYSMCVGSRLESFNAPRPP